MEMKQLESFCDRLRTRKHFTSCGLHVPRSQTSAKTIRTLEHELGRPFWSGQEGRTAYGLWEDRTGVCEADSEGNGYDLLFSRAG